MIDRSTFLTGYIKKYYDAVMIPAFPLIKIDFERKREGKKVISNKETKYYLKTHMRYLVDIYFTLRTLSNISKYTMLLISRNSLGEHDQLLYHIKNSYIYMGILSNILITYIEKMGNYYEPYVIHNKYKILKKELNNIINIFFKDYIDIRNPLVHPGNNQIYFQEINALAEQNIFIEQYITLNKVDTSANSQKNIKLLELINDYKSNLNISSKDASNKMEDTLSNILIMLDDFFKQLYHLLAPNCNLVIPWDLEKKTR